MSQAVDHYGDDAMLPLRQDNTIKGPLATYGAVSGGATSLLAAGGRVTGDAVQGSAFEIDGVAGSYTVADTVTATPGGRVTLNFSPPLEGPAPDGAAILWTQAYGETPYSIMSGSRTEYTKEEIERGVQSYAIAWAAGKPAPRDAGNDTLGGQKIVKVLPLNAGGGVSGWRVTTSVTP
jgi:hypothetical protein